MQLRGTTLFRRTCVSFARWVFARRSGETIKLLNSYTTAIWERETSVLSNFLALFRFDSDAHGE